MVLKDILAISGEPGLFKFIAQGKNATIVEHLETGKRSSVFGSTKINSLEDISVFTQDEDLPLAKVFDRIFEKEAGGQAIDAKSDPEKLKLYFQEVVPEYARDKVYLSDIKKILIWYNLLQKKDMLVKEEAEKESGADKEETESSEAPVQEKAKVKKEAKEKTDNRKSTASTGKKMTKG